MILRINYETEEGTTKTAQIKDYRIKSKKDRERLENIIKKKYGYKSVVITNWKVIGRIGEKIDRYK